MLCKHIADLHFTLHVYSSAYLTLQISDYYGEGPAFQVVNVPYGLASDSQLTFAAVFYYGYSQMADDVTFGLASDEGLTMVDGSTLQCRDSNGEQRTVTVVSSSDVNNGADNTAALAVFRHANLIEVESRNESSYIVCDTSLGIAYSLA